MKKYYLFSLLLILLTVIPGYCKTPKGDIIIDVKNFRNSKGCLRVYLLRPKAYFPEKAGEIERSFKKRIRYVKDRIIFRDVPYGHYAVFIHHDRNENGRIDYKRLGKPREGFGASRRGITDLGKLNFPKAKFYHKFRKTKLLVSLNYYN